MKSIPQISDTEWQVMKVVWNQSPITANQVVEAMKGTTDWKPNTIKTLLSRLNKKKTVGFYKEGREFYFYPLIPEEDCVKVENASFLQKVYGGSFNIMLASFFEDQKLTPDEIQDLKNILDKKME